MWSWQYAYYCKFVKNIENIYSEWFLELSEMLSKTKIDSCSI